MSLAYHTSFSVTTYLVHLAAYNLVSLRLFLFVVRKQRINFKWKPDCGQNIQAKLEKIYIIFVKSFRSKLQSCAIFQFANICQTSKLSTTGFRQILKILKREFLKITGNLEKFKI